jgi:hypothetical protein
LFTVETGEVLSRRGAIRISQKISA